MDNAAQLIKDAFTQYRTTLPPEAWQTWFEYMMDIRGRLIDSQLIVAESEGRLAGTVTLYLKCSLQSHERWPEGWAGIRLLAVHPDFRSRGIGRTLIEECIRRSRNNGNIAVALHTSEIMAAARRIYEKMGFIRVPEFDFSLGTGTLVTSYRMDLKPESRTKTHGS